MREQLGVLILVFVLVLLLVAMYIFRADHDIVLSINQWIAGVVGGILALITGKVAHSAAQLNTISANTVNAPMEPKA